MFKTVIYKLEGVLINREILTLKQYEILWQHLRRRKEWKNFSQLMGTREKLSRRYNVQDAHLRIAKNYLTEREYHNYQHEIAYYAASQQNVYMRKTPAMGSIMQVTRYYYKNSLLSGDPELLQRANKRFRFDHSVRYMEAYRENQQDGGEWEALQQLLKKSNSEPQEAVLVSDRLDSDIAAANRMGLYTIQTRFSSEVKGLQPQLIREKQYFESHTRVPAYPVVPRQGLQRPDAVARHPEEIIRLLQKAEDKSSGKKMTGEKRDTQQVSVWDELRKNLFPELEVLQQNRSGKTGS
ncbi:MAG: HAD hydrolase-like protein [Calditrichia bacterium]